MSIELKKTLIRSAGNAVVLIFVVSSLIACQAGSPVEEKINGLSFVASRQEITQDDLKPVLKVNANAIAVMPFAFMQNLRDPAIRFNSERQWWGEREEGVRKTIQLARAEGLVVMLKPQIWISRGDFTGNIEMRSEEDWQKLEVQYLQFIIFYAQLAESEQVDIFCIGTELNSFVQARPAFWEDLIREVRKVYNGRLTYAENWDRIENVYFWEGLDFIGVDAYFPLSEEVAPTVEEMKKAWKPIKKNLIRLSSTNNKPVLFTEYGYRNIDYAAREPWDSSRELGDINFGVQANALAALYEEVWQEEWFAGGFIWKWFHNHKNSGGLQDSQFTPQNKPAEKVVRDYYGRFSS